MLRFKYDREADILHIDKCPPYLEVLFFTTRLLRADLFELPVTADLRLVNTGG